MPEPLRERLDLNEKQRKQVDELQKEVDARLAKILTSASPPSSRMRRTDFASTARSPRKRASGRSCRNPVR